MSEIFQYLFAVFTFAAGTFFFGNESFFIPAKNQPLLLPPEGIEHFTFGYGESLADSLWVRSIQDFDYCGRAFSRERKVISSETSHSSTFLHEEDSSSSQQPAEKPAQCEKGWSFRMLDTITNLSPQFDIVYTMGAPGLSIVLDDREGAEILFDKGVKALPHYWQISYMAAYHALFETKKLAKAASLLKQAGENGAPEWVYFLATQMYNKVGMAELAKSVITEYIQKFPPDQIPLRAKQRLEEVEASLKNSNRAEDQKRAVSSATQDSTQQ